MAMTPIRPELGLQDWSPVARGGEAFGRGIGQGLAALGQGIGKAMEKRADFKATIASAKTQLKAISENSTLPEEIRQDALSRLDAIESPDINLREQAAIAGQAIQGIGIVQNLGLQELDRRLKIGRAEAQDQENKQRASRTGYKTEDEAIKAAQKQVDASGGKLQIGTISQNGPGGTWTYSLGGVDASTDPAQVQLYQLQKQEQEAMIRLLAEGKDGEAMLIADRLGLKDQIGNPFESADQLRARFGVTPATPKDKPAPEPKPEPIAEEDEMVPDDLLGSRAKRQPIVSPYTSAMRGLY
jgi:hypothetical protein